MLKSVDRSTENALFDRIDPTEMERHLDAFSGLTRVSGSADEWKASEYIVDVLNKYGVTAELHEFEGYISVPESGKLVVTSPTKRELDAITVSFSASTSVAGTHADVVRVESFDQSVAESRYLEGKIAFVQEMPKPYIVRYAERAGVSGLICQSPNEHRYQGIVTPVWGTPSTDTKKEIPDIPVVEINHPDGEWLAGRLEHGSVEATLKTEVTTELTNLPCPVGTIDGVKSDRYFLIGNHVDSWFEGITDNATAMATTIEIARIFAERNEPPRRGLKFGFWPGHSTGRYAGSAWYADTNWLDLRKNGVAYLHIDLPGLKGADGLWYQHMAELEDEHIHAMETATNIPIRKSDESYLGSTGRPARNSDQSFWGTGLSSLLSGARLTPQTEAGGPVGGGWWWHTPEDTRDKVDIDVLVEETKLYVSLATRICESVVLPHDYTATVQDIRNTLVNIESNADDLVLFDDIHDDLDKLEELLERVRAEVNEYSEDTPPAAIADIEHLQVTLGNLLNPGLYMETAEHEHEPRRPFRQLPYLRVAESLPELTGCDRRFAETKIQRGRMKLAHRVRKSIQETKTFLEISPDRYE